jgi:hypothetical protein
MDISINAKVSCADGPCGKTTRVILKPASEEITHLVVNNESFPEIEYLVSINHVTDSTVDQIRLDCTREELSNMPVFDKMEFVPAIMTGFNGSPYMMWPYSAPAGAYVTLEKVQIPAGELSIRHGARVNASDGPIGRVDEFLVDPGNDQITHLVMREGHLWGQKDVTIPVGQIDHYKENTVYLKLSKQEIEKLPGIPVRRSSTKMGRGEQKYPDNGK